MCCSQNFSVIWSDNLCLLASLPKLIKFKYINKTLIFSIVLFGIFTLGESVFERVFENRGYLYLNW